MELFRTEMLQDLREIDGFAAALVVEDVRSYLEIGSKFGGSLWRVGSVLPRGSRLVVVDLPSGNKRWKDSSVSLQACAAVLRGMGQSVEIIWGNSQEQSTIDKVKKLAPFDACFIDADHRAPGVRLDWANYGPLARIVAFHDISWHRAPEWVGTRIDVPEFWREIKGNFNHREFRFCGSKDNGIGMLWNGGFHGPRNPESVE